MSFCYAIKDWEKHFENSESRKIKSLTWLPVKNKHDGKGYRRVIAHPKGCLVFCAWNLIIQVASKMPVRGVLRDDDGPITANDMAFKTGAPEHIFETAFQVLTDPKIGWLVQQNPPAIPASPETSAAAGTEWNRTEQNGTERNGNPPPLIKSSLERGDGGKPEDAIGHGAQEVPDEDQAVVLTMTAGVDEGFARYVHRTWLAQSGRNGNGVSVAWLPYVVGRWKNEGTEWRNGTHRGNRASSAAAKSSGEASTGGVEAFNRSKELEEVNRKVASLMDRDPHMDMTDKDRAELKRLKARRNELHKLLGWQI